MGGLVVWCVGWWKYFMIRGVEGDVVGWFFDYGVGEKWLDGGLRCWIFEFGVLNVDWLFCC